MPPFDRKALVAAGDAILSWIDAPRRETDFLPAALEVIERPASPTARLLALTIVAFVILATLWAAVGRVDIIATAPGKILPIGNSKLIQPLEPGVVTAIAVNDGDHVKAGTVLVQLDPVNARSESEKLTGDLQKTRIEIARLEGLRRFIAGQPIDLVDPPVGAPADEIETARAALHAQVAEQQAKLQALERQIAAKTAEMAEATAGIEKLQESIPVAVHEEALRRQLKDMAYGNEWAWLQAQEHLIDQQHSLPGLIQHRDQAAAAAQALRRQVEETQAEFEKTVLSDLTQAQEKAADFAKDRDKALERVSLLTLRAPIDGTVQQLAIHTVGGVVTPAQVLLVLVPDAGGLLVEAHIANKDVGFVRPGQTAEIKIETFNFTRYGLIEGTVIDVSRDSVIETAEQARSRGSNDDSDKKSDAEPPDSAGYVAHISLDRAEMMTEAGPVALGPGMRVTAEIKTGQRTVLSYLLSPVIRYRKESFHER